MRSASNRVVVLDPLHLSALDRLRCDFDLTAPLRPVQAEVPDLIRDKHVVILRSGVMLDEDAFESADSLHLIVRAGVGLDNIDLVSAHARGIKVVNVPGVSANAVAELALGLMLSVARMIPEAEQAFRSGRAKKEHFMGRELFGSTMGVVGLGGIGERIATIARGLGMSVIGAVANHDERRRLRLARDGIDICGIDEVLGRADIVCLAVPLDPSTRALMDSKRIAGMKPGSILINVSRAEVVDHVALGEALRRGHLAGAALDVVTESDDHVLADLPNVVMTPHIGAMTEEAQRRIGDEVVRLVTEEFTDRVPAGLEHG